MGRALWLRPSPAFVRTKTRNCRKGNLSVLKARSAHVFGLPQTTAWSRSISGGSMFALIAPATTHY